MKKWLEKLNLKNDSIFKYILRINKFGLAAVALLQLSCMLISFFILNIYTYLVNGVLEETSDAVKKLMLAILGYVILVVVQCIFSMLNMYLSSNLGLKTDIKIRPIIVDRILGKSGEYFNGANGGELFEVVMQDVSTVSSFVMGKIVYVSGLAFGVIGSIVYLTLINWKSVIIILLFQIASYFTQKKISKRVMTYSEDARVNAGQYVSSIQDVFLNPVAMITSGLKKSFVKRMDNKMIENYKLNKKLIFIDILGDQILAFISSLTTCVVVGFNILCVLKGTMSLGYFTAFLVCLTRLMTQIEGCWSFSIDLYQVKPMYDRVNELYLQKNENRSGYVQYSQAPDIEFNGVTFTYDNVRTIYDNLNYRFEYGKKYGIIGRTGEGKSTMVKLIYDLWNTSQGKVKLGGTDCRNLSVDQVDDYINYVSASSIVIQDTIYNNIIFGNKEISKKDACEILKKVCLYDEVMQMDDGIDTLVGEMGSTLSSGQQQRLMLARALASSKKILILDEPTSALDVNTEEEVIKQIYDNSFNKTLIIISHNKSILDRCDEVIHLEDGKFKVA